MKMLPSVTQILGLFQSWDHISPGILAEAAARGTAVHSYCATYAQSFYVIATQYEGYFRSFKNWFNQYVDSVILIETRLDHPVYQYTGKIDLVCRMKHNNGAVLVDYKTSTVANKIWMAQLAAYRALISNVIVRKFYETPSLVGSLLLDKDGGAARFVSYNNDDLDDAFNAFLNALFAFKYFGKE